MNRCPPTRDLAQAPARCASWPHAVRVCGPLPWDWGSCAQDWGKNGEDLARGAAANAQGLADNVVSGTKYAISWTKDRTDSGIDSLNRIWQDSGGAGINAVAKDPLGVAVGFATIGVAGLCVSALASTGVGAIAAPGCLFALGAGSYSGSVFLKNLITGNSPLSEWNPYGAAASGVAGVVIPGLATELQPAATMGFMATQGSSPAAITIATLGVLVTSHVSSPVTATFIGAFLGFYPDV